MRDASHDEKVNARDLRRKILSALEGQQQAESKSAEHLRFALKIGNRRVLKILSKILIRASQNADTFCDEARTIRSITKEFDITTWLQLSGRRSAIDKQRSLAVMEESAASRSYESHSPWGFLSRIAQSDSDTRRSLELKALFELSQARRLGIERELDQVNNQLKALAEIYLREASLTSSVEAILATTLTDAEELKGVLASLTERLQVARAELSAYHAASFANIEEDLQVLKRHYLIS